jgi:hypothetical protein
MGETLRAPQLGAAPPEPPPEMRELAELLTDLFQKSSELALACIEIGEEDLKSNPALRELRDSCLEVTRIVRKVMKLSRRVQR